MASAVSPAFLESEAKKLKRDLEGWREVLLYASSLITWQDPLAPAIVGGSVSLIFLTLWYLDPNVLTLTAGLCLTLTLLDYLVPIISAQVFKQDDWTAAKERELDNICKSLALYKITITKSVKGFCAMRSEQPKKYYFIAVVGLLILFWLGNTLNNLLLSYFVVLAVTMAPGLKQKGVLAPMLDAIDKAFGSFFPTSKEVKSE